MVANYSNCVLVFKNGRSLFCWQRNLKSQDMYKLQYSISQYYIQHTISVTAVTNWLTLCRYYQIVFQRLVGRCEDVAEACLHFKVSYTGMIHIQKKIMPMQSNLNFHPGMTFTTTFFKCRRQTATKELQILKKLNSFKRAWNSGGEQRSSTLAQLKHFSALVTA